MKTNEDIISMATQYCQDMKEFFDGYEQQWTVSKKNVVGLLESALALLVQDTVESVEVAELKAEIERLEGIEQDNEYMKSELEEYHRREDREEADADLVAQMRREQGLSV